MKQNHFFGRAAIAALALCVSTVAEAETLTEMLRERQGKIDGIVQVGDEPSGERRDRLSAVLGELIDFEEMARRSLGREWKSRAAEDRSEFVRRFERLVRLNSVRDLDVYQTTSVEYTAEEVEGDKATVRTVVSREEAVTDVDYRFQRAQERWAIVDYVIDGVSTTRSYRRQFRKILREHGWDELLARLDTRAQELAEEQAGES